MEVVEQMQAAIATLTITDAPTHRLTLSFGIYAAVPQQSTKATAALALADQALYAAKEAGRNQYVVSPDIAVVNL